MKKKVILFFLIVMCGFFISCGSGSGDPVYEGDTGNSGDTGDAGNTGNIDDGVDTGDLENSEDKDDLKNDEDNNDTDDFDDADDTDPVSIPDCGPDGKGGDMCLVPEGEFWMGCNELLDIECEKDEFPYHKVFLSTYKIDKYEVTVEEYQKCIDSGWCNNNNADEPHYAVYEPAPSYCNIGKTDKDRSQHPVNCVSWFGAKAYCDWIGKRLPTEAEWEKAARGTDGRLFPWGNEPASCDFAVMNGDGEDAEGCGANGTIIVGSRESGRSPYGIYDMAGNVSEFVNDYYDPLYYEISPSSNPSGPESGETYSLRGGDWLGIYGRLNTSSRMDALSFPTTDTYGFRCALSE